MTAGLTPVVVPPHLPGDADADQRMAHSRMRMRAAGVLYSSAGVLMLAAVLLSSDHHLLAYVIPGAAMTTGLVVLAIGARVFVPIWVNDLLSVSGSILIGILAASVNPALADVPGVFVVYVAAYAYFFYDRPRALFHTVVGAVAYGAGLGLAGAEFVLPRWLVIAGASIVAAVLVARLAEADRRASETARAAAERARRLAATRELLLVAVSHELRTPLTMVAGTATTLRERFDQLDDGRRRELLVSQDTNAQRLVQLVEDLDSLHQLSQEALVAARETVDLRACLLDAVPDDLAGVLDLEVTAPSVSVRLDPRFVRRIVENLLRNTVRHTPPGTPVRLAGRATDGLVVLEVVDAGRGIPDELKQAVFEPFVRLHTERRGTGVGLALVAAFARSHGGTATVKDNPGGGSIFHVTLDQSASDAGGHD